MGIGFGSKLQARKDMGISRGDMKNKYDLLNEFYLKMSVIRNDICSDYLNEWGLENV